MPDNKSKRGKRDRDRINIHEDYELRGWAKRLAVTQEELKKAVQKVGPSAEGEKAFWQVSKRELRSN